MNLDWDSLRAILNKHKRFILTSHIRPDCDALGSEMGMAGILQAMGKEVTIINGHQTPPSLYFMDPAQSILVIGDTITHEEIEGDCLIVLDTSAWAQLGPMAEVLRKFNGPKVVIDHHVGEDDLGAQFFKDTSAEATGHLVAKLAEHLNVPISRTMANALYAAIATDTGWFRFDSTTSETYRVIAKLVDAGASPSTIYGDLYERDTVGRVRLRGRILARVQVECNGQLVHTHVRKEDFVESGALASDTEDAINLTLAIEGTKVAIILIEQLKGGFKVSFRSRCHVDCNELARQFGGGGHRAAAGAFIEAEFADVQARVLQAARQAIANKPGYA
ncbi:MAG: bifunctional oligoribonuclease/PAP phosphatase NrnA [Pirellula sp.]|jgi:phosphoesterase RecJ-like protein|nr:bifunctional oligoribonuclease/PAP phosphatase NrnA [Pirellula sp.]